MVTEEHIAKATELADYIDGFPEHADQAEALRALLDAVKAMPMTKDGRVAVPDRDAVYYPHFHRPEVMLGSEMFCMDDEWFVNLGRVVDGKYEPSEEVGLVADSYSTREAAESALSSLTSKEGGE